jgi:hypothetical protein
MMRHWKVLYNVFCKDYQRVHIIAQLANVVNEE